jgi:hypothetical protein
MGDERRQIIGTDGDAARGAREGLDVHVAPRA